MRNAILPLAFLILIGPPTTAAQMTPQEADKLVGQMRGGIICLQSRTLAPGIQRESNCHAKDTTPFGKTVVSTRYSPASLIVTTIYDNGWPPTIELCSQIEGNNYCISPEELDREHMTKYLMIIEEKLKESVAMYKERMKAKQQ